MWIRTTLRELWKGLYLREAQCLQCTTACKWNAHAVHHPHWCCSASLWVHLLSTPPHPLSWGSRLGAPRRCSPGTPDQFLHTKGEVVLASLWLLITIQRLDTTWSRINRNCEVSFPRYSSSFYSMTGLLKSDSVRDAWQLLTSYLSPSYIADFE